MKIAPGRAIVQVLDSCGIEGNTGGSVAKKKHHPNLVHLACIYFLTEARLSTIGNTVIGAYLTPEEPVRDQPKLRKYCWSCHSTLIQEVSDKCIEP